MIAPLRETQQTPSKRKLLRARMAVAASLLPAKPQPNTVPPIANWKAWAWAGWIVLVATAFVVHTAIEFAAR